MAQHGKQNLPLQLSKQQQLRTAFLLQLLEHSQQWEQEVTTTKFVLVLRDPNVTGKNGTQPSLGLQLWEQLQLQQWGSGAFSRWPWQ